MHTSYFKKVCHSKYTYSNVSTVLQWLCCLLSHISSLRLQWAVSYISVNCEMLNGVIAVLLSATVFFSRDDTHCFLWPFHSSSSSPSHGQCGGFLARQLCGDPQGDRGNGKWACLSLHLSRYCSISGRAWKKRHTTLTENKAKNSGSALIDLQPQFTNASAY